MTPRRIVGTAIYSAALWAGLIVAARPLAAKAPPDTSLTKEVLGDGIYLFRAPSALDLWTATNVVVIVNDQDVTVFDSNTRARTARMVIAEIRKLTPKPVRTLINSHWHQDHWSGNDEYVKAFPGIQIVATTKTRDYMKYMGPDTSRTASTRRSLVSALPSIRQFTRGSRATELRSRPMRARRWKRRSTRPRRSRSKWRT